MHANIDENLYNQLGTEERKKLDEARELQPFEPSKLQEMLKQPGVESVTVRPLKKHDKFRAMGNQYLVTKVLPNGKITIKPV